MTNASAEIKNLIFFMNIFLESVLYDFSDVFGKKRCFSKFQAGGY